MHIFFDLSERVSNWVAQLIGEGFLEAGSSSSSSTQAPVTSSEPSSDSLAKALEELEMENAKLRQMLDTNSRLLEDNIVRPGSKTVESDESKTDTNGYTSHYNPKTGSTMWTSADGKSCYHTTIDPKISSFKP